METAEIIKAKALILVEVLEYIPHSIVIKTIIKRATGNISAYSFDTGEAFRETICPFDTFIQIIEGKAEISINGSAKLLETGQSIIIPAHSRHGIKAHVRFKMLSTTIKSGYEEFCADSIQ